MRECGVPQVVQEPGEAHFSNLFSRKGQVLGHPSGHVHGSQRMLESAMDRTRIDRLHQTQLLDALQSLHRSGKDETALQFIDPDSSMNRVANGAGHNLF